MSKLFISPGLQFQADLSIAHQYACGWIFLKMSPEHVYRLEVDMPSTAQTFKAGHRLLVEVTSSDFPRYDRNLNTGGPFGEEVR